MKLSKFDLINKINDEAKQYFYRAEFFNDNRGQYILYSSYSDGLDKKPFFKYYYIDNLNLLNSWKVVKEKLNGKIMNAETLKFLGLDTLVNFGYGEPPIRIVCVTKHNNEYIVTNIENPQKNKVFSSKEELLSELVLDGGVMHSVDAFDDQTGENIFMDFPRRYNK
jgi:hypothetical protein